MPAVLAQGYLSASCTSHFTGHTLNLSEMESLNTGQRFLVSPQVRTKLWMHRLDYQLAFVNVLSMCICLDFWLCQVNSPWLIKTLGLDSEQTHNFCWSFRNRNTLILVCNLINKISTNLGVRSVQIRVRWKPDYLIWDIAKVALNSLKTSSRK